MTDDEAIRLFWRLLPLALLAGILLGILSLHWWWVPGTGYVYIP